MQKFKIIFGKAKKETKHHEPPMTNAEIIEIRKLLNIDIDKKPTNYPHAYSKTL